MHGNMHPSIVMHGQRTDGEHALTLVQVLYNTSLYSSVGAGRASAIWASGTYGATPAPFTLMMQAVSALQQPVPHVCGVVLSSCMPLCQP